MSYNNYISVKVNNKQPDDNDALKVSELVDNHENNENLQYKSYKSKQFKQLEINIKDKVKQKISDTKEKLQNFKSGHDNQRISYQNVAQISNQEVQSNLTANPLYNSTLMQQQTNLNNDLKLSTQRNKINDSVFNASLQTKSIVDNNSSHQQQHELKPNNNHQQMNKSQMQQTTQSSQGCKNVQFSMDDGAVQIEANRQQLACKTQNENQDIRTQKQFRGQNLKLLQKMQNLKNDINDLRKSTKQQEQSEQTKKFSETDLQCNAGVKENTEIFIDTKLNQSTRNPIRNSQKVIQVQDTNEVLHEQIKNENIDDMYQTCHLEQLINDQLSTNDIYQEISSKSAQIKEKIKFQEDINKEQQINEHQQDLLNECNQYKQEIDAKVGENREMQINDQYKLNEETFQKSFQDDYEEYQDTTQQNADDLQQMKQNQNVQENQNKLNYNNKQTFHYSKNQYFGQQQNQQELKIDKPQINEFEQNRIQDQYNQQQCQNNALEQNISPIQYQINDIHIDKFKKQQVVQNNQFFTEQVIQNTEKSCKQISDTQQNLHQITIAQNNSSSDRSPVQQQIQNKSSNMTIDTVQNKSEFNGSNLVKEIYEANYNLQKIFENKLNQQKEKFNTSRVQQTTQQECSANNKFLQQSKQPTNKYFNQMIDSQLGITKSYKAQKTNTFINNAQEIQEDELLKLQLNVIKASTNKSIINSNTISPQQRRYNDIKAHLLINEKKDQKLSDNVSNVQYSDYLNKSKYQLQPCEQQFINQQQQQYQQNQYTSYQQQQIKNTQQPIQTKVQEQQDFNQHQRNKDDLQTTKLQVQNQPYLQKHIDIHYYQGLQKQIKNLINDLSDQEIQQFYSKQK